MYILVTGKVPCGNYLCDKYIEPKMNISSTAIQVFLITVFLVKFCVNWTQKPVFRKTQFCWTGNFAGLHKFYFLPESYILMKI